MLVMLGVELGLNVGMVEVGLTMPQLRVTIGEDDGERLAKSVRNLISESDVTRLSCLYLAGAEQNKPERPRTSL